MVSNRLLFTYMADSMIRSYTGVITIWAFIPGQALHEFEAAPYDTTTGEVSAN